MTVLTRPSINWNLNWNEGKGTIASPSPFFLKNSLGVIGSQFEAYKRTHNFFWHLINEISFKNDLDAMIGPLEGSLAHQVPQIKVLLYASKNGLANHYC